MMMTSHELLLVVKSCISWLWDPRSCSRWNEKRKFRNRRVLNLSWSFSYVRNTMQGLYPVYTMKLVRRASSSSQLHRVNGVLRCCTDSSNYNIHYSYWLLTHYSYCFNVHVVSWQFWVYEFTSLAFWSRLIALTVQWSSGCYSWQLVGRSCHL